MSEPVAWNRAERRRRGMTRSRLKRTGSLASAGVLVSAGLFGAYVGNPRLQRAYASPVCSGAVRVTGPGDDTLVAALDDSTVTCIEIQGQITLSADLPTIDDDYWTGGPRDSSLGLTLYGVGGDDTIDGAGSHAGLAILVATPLDDTVSLSLSGLTMTNLSSSASAGGAVSIGVVYGAAALSVCGSYFADNIAESGGAIFASSVSPGTLRINNPGCSSGPTTFARNTATGSDGGGAIFTGLDAYIYETDFTGNTATHVGSSGRGGGAIAGFNSYDDTLSVRVFESTFTDDTSATDGGAISAQGRVDVSGVTFAGNRSDGNGGAIAGRFVYADNGTQFLDNSADDGGGAVFCYVDTSYDCRVDVSGVTFAENWSYSGGGAIAGQFVYADNGTQFLDNSAGDDGGAITAYRVGLDGVLIEGNGAHTGGGVHVTQDLSTVSNSTIYDNTAWVMGGGIYVGDSVTVSYSAIIGNRAVDDTYADATGGGIAGFSNSEVLLTNSYVGGNQADDTAGGIYFRPGSQSHLGLYFTTVYDDTVTSGGGHAEFDVHSLTAVGSAVGNQWATNVWSAYVVDDTAFITDDSLASWSPGVGSHVLAPGQGLALGTRDDTLTPGHAGRTPLAGSPLITGAPSSFFGVLPAGEDQLGVDRTAPFTIGARQFVAPTPPPGPSGVPPSAPRDPRAVAGDRQAVVSWSAPVDSGSFPVTDYEVASVPAGGSCLVKVPSLSCTVSGLDNGTSYVFRVRALNGAGWSPESVASNGVMPRPGPSILVTGTRDGNRVRVRGATQGVTSSTVTPRYHFAGEVDYTTGVARPRIDASGEFTWSRIAGRTIYVYFAADGTRSNRLVLKREG